MAIDAMHLLATHSAIEIRRQQGPGLLASHGITSTLLPFAPPGDAPLFSGRSSGICKPKWDPISRAYDERRCRRASLPRVSRDFTVPSDTCVISAISSY